MSRERDGDDPVVAYVGRRLLRQVAPLPGVLGAQALPAFLEAVSERARQRSPLPGAGVDAEYPFHASVPPDSIN